jgi:sucrose phosphorylase
VRNGVQLITYADRFGSGDLSTIRELLIGPLAGVFTGIHLLPFYTPFDRADAGFDPIDHRSVDPRLGDWQDIQNIADTHDVTADLIVNHISIESHQFTDYVRNGKDSAYAGMFLEYDSVFPDGATGADLLGIYRPRPGLPFTAITMSDETRRLLWTTFTSDQVDLDVTNPRALRYLLDVLDRLAGSGVGQVRLDAIGYAIKIPGTSGFMTPETYEFIEDIESEVRARGMQSLLEIHSHHSDQVRAAEAADRVYDFALPPLILHALQTGSASPLRRWLESSPRNVVTVLDTHDGIGIIDVGRAGNRAGLLPPDEISDLVEGIHRASDGESRLATGRAASNLDLYQVNCTYFSALGCDEDAYLLARLTQFLSPGVPQVYYAGLLAARNDTELLNETGIGRNINRPYYTREQIEMDLERPVVRRLLAMTRFRNTHPAFNGSFRLGDGESHELRLGWEAEGASIDAVIDFDQKSFLLTLVSKGVEDRISDWDGF